jgi:hypothetical protein
MDNQELQPSEKHEAVHVCEQCGTRFRPGQVNEDVIIMLIDMVSQRSASPDVAVVKR